MSEQGRGKHTPGPWHANIVPGQHLHTVAGECDHPWVCEASESNARLIAAAPAMLEALQMVINETNAGLWDCLPIEKAKAAIRAATGE
jgi:hypothetical protein